MEKEQFQPKDSGKLTNFHYGSEEDRRSEEALTDDGAMNIKSVKRKEE